MRRNLVITGQAGCGKTFLVRELVQELRSKGKCVAVTCSTGIAATHFSSDLNAQTLHKWGGLEDGRHLLE
ncbi:AAA family ATPase [Solemya velum gill symbiont]|uniref:AAA family ATPase n=1 Tax=Solemya velum gill symbiont TaxID=2340 RepID=UPI0009964A4D